MATSSVSVALSVALRIRQSFRIAAVVSGAATAASWGC